jgi:hypothetical protein
MARMTEAQRTEWATRPDLIPTDATCDRCERQAVARGTDGHRADAFCETHFMDSLAERRAARPTRDQLVARVAA